MSGKFFVFSVAIFSISACGAKLTPDLLGKGIEPKNKLRFLEKNYGSCSEYAAQVKQGVDSLNQSSAVTYVEEAAQPSAMSDGLTGSPASNIQTNIQVNGIDESDMLKSSENQIFVLNSNSDIEVLNRKNFAKIGVLKNENGNRTKTDFYVTDNSLIVIFNKYVSSGNQKFEVLKYQLQSSSLPTLVSEKEFEGRFSETRLIGDNLVVSSQVSLSDYDSNQKKYVVKSEYFSDGTVASVDCSRVVQVAIQNDNANSVIDDTIISLTRLSTFDIKSPDLSARHIGVPGYYFSNKSYFSQKSAYLVSSFYDETSILKIPFDENSLIQVGSVKGYVKDRWAMHELLDESLAVATTDFGWSRAERTVRSASTIKNNLYILTSNDGLLKPVGKLENFGINETIKSVRYINEMAYVVTFRQTDPLFAIDISNRTSPELVGDLKVPGFSEYLHPVDDKLLIGVGRDADEQSGRASGIQVSLFDISNPAKLARLDAKVSGSAGTSTRISYDAHAFFINSAQKIFAIPVFERNSTDVVDSNGSYSYSFSTSALFYKYSSGKLSLINQLTEAGTSSPYINTSIRHIAEIDDKVLFLSSTSLRAYSASDIYSGISALPIVETKLEERIETSSIGGWCGTQPLGR